MDKNLGDRSPTPIQQREVPYTLKARRKKTEHASVQSNLLVIPDEGKLDAVLDHLDS
jgi:hypothetical protein